MDIADSDMTLFRLYSEMESFLAVHAAECVTAEKAGDERLDTVAIRQAQLRQQDTERQWRSAIKQMAQLSARAQEGSFAKNGVIQMCFRYHLSEDTDVMQLIRSHIADLDSVLDSDGRMSRLKRSSALHHPLRTRPPLKRKVPHNHE